MGYVVYCNIDKTILMAMCLLVEEVDTSTSNIVATIFQSTENAHAWLNMQRIAVVDEY